MVNKVGGDIEYPDEIHVLPMDDLYDHEPSGNCWCHPHREDTGTEEFRFVWVHNCLDDADEDVMH